MSTQPDSETESSAADAQPDSREKPQPETDSSGEPSHQERRMAEKAARQDQRDAEAAEEASDPGETIELKVFRYDPDIEGKREPRFDEFQIPVHPGMTVLDALIYARDEFDPSLTFRHSCRQAICGSDAFFVNGRQCLGCQTQIEDLSEPVRVEPLPHADVEKDLVVDMEHFYDQMESVEPFFDTTELPDGDLEEQRQSRENREEIKMGTRCIWCASCMSSCNIAAEDNDYLGPAALSMAYRFYMDEREGEEKQRERMEIIAANHGVWRCQTQFSCTNVCPKDIPLTEHIQELKREGVKNNLKFW